MDINSRHADFYQALEAKFRGSRETVRARLEVYGPYLDAILKMSSIPRALDLGCGRGEWLELLTERGFSPFGVDLDDSMLEFCRERGLEVLSADAIEVLSKQADSSLSLISGFHIAEHLSFDKLQILIDEAARALRPGGLLILETPNPENLRVSTHTFYIDPTHTRPLPPSLLDFMTEYYGFARSKVLRLNESRDIISSTAISIEDVYSGVSRDYCVVAQKAGDADAMAAAEHAFSIELGITNEMIFDRFNQSTERLCETVFDRCNNALQHRLESEEQARLHLAHKLASIENSTSWKVTAPARKAVEKAKWFCTSVDAWTSLRPRAPSQYSRNMPLSAYLLRRNPRLNIATTLRHLAAFVRSRPLLYRRVVKLSSMVPPLDRAIRNRFASNHAPTTHRSSRHLVGEQDMTQSCAPLTSPWERKLMSRLEALVSRGELRK